MFYRGEFDKPAGLIYDCFDEDLHVIDPMPIPHHWPRMVGIDPIGAVTAGVLLAWDPDGQRLHVYDEYYGPYGKTTAEHASEVMQQVKLRPGAPVVAWVGGSKSEIKPGWTGGRRACPSRSRPSQTWRAALTACTGCLRNIATSSTQLQTPDR